jgi:hypothetical protein
VEEEEWDARLGFDPCKGRMSLLTLLRTHLPATCEIPFVPGTKRPERHAYY